MKHIKLFESFDEELEKLDDLEDEERKLEDSITRQDVAVCIMDLLEGDDVEFEPIEEDEWERIGLIGFYNMCGDITDMYDYFEEMEEEKFKEIKRKLILADYL